MEQIKSVAISELEAHPRNPRLFYRDEVLDSLVAQLTESGEFSEMYAPIVRPVNDHYEIVSGHHRIEAARRVGMEVLPCWVKDMTDEDAYMQLVLSNAQGELSPLEIGIHVLGAVENATGGAGKTGGLSEYARLVGKGQSYITQVRQAAEVYGTVKTHYSGNMFQDKAKHLAAIHKAEPGLWPMLVEWMMEGIETDKDKGKSVNQTEELVKAIGKYDIAEPWDIVFLPLGTITRTYMETNRPAVKDVEELTMLARFTEEAITKAQEAIGETFPFTVDEYRGWLSGGIDDYAWRPEELQKYRDEVTETSRVLQKPPDPDAQPGEWYELGDHLLYCGDTGSPDFWQDLPTVAFAFADPPYNAGAAEWDYEFKWKHDWLADKAAITAVTPGIVSIQSFFAQQTSMPYAWSMACFIDNGMTRGAIGFGNWIYIALFGEGSLHRKAQDVIRCSIETSKTEETDHKGRKPLEMLKHLLLLFTKEGETVIDPFLGSGSTLDAASETGRLCIGGDIDPAYCNEIIKKWQDNTGQTARRRDHEQNAI